MEVDIMNKIRYRTAEMISGRGALVRTVISLSQRDKEWLDNKAREEGVPMTEVVRRAVDLLREHSETDAPTFEELLEKTGGSWPHGDGLDYQRELRDEW
jgi:hypothetical protein